MSPYMVYSGPFDLPPGDPQAGQVVICDAMVNGRCPRNGMGMNGNSRCWHAVPHKRRCTCTCSCAKLIEGFPLEHNECIPVPENYMGEGYDG